MKLVVLGLSLSSSWGNGHATTYRALLKSFAARGHDVVFLERDVPWYRENRDLPHPPYARTLLYASVDELRQRFTTGYTYHRAVVFLYRLQDFLDFHTHAAVKRVFAVAMMIDSGVARHLMVGDRVLRARSFS